MKTGGGEISVKNYIINYDLLVDLNKVQNKGHYLGLDLKNEIVNTGWIL